jgi:hypothetical protein
MHRLGESFVEKVSDVRRRATDDGEAISPGESLEFLAHIRGWQSEARKQRRDQLACHCWGLTRGCLSASPGGRPRAAVCGFPAVWVVCRGLRCGLCLVTWGVGGAGVGRRHMQRGQWGGCLRSGAALVDVHLYVVPLQSCSSSQTVAGCLLGGYPVGRDWWGGERVVGGVLVTPH